jgi:hypothetical protein
MTVTLQGRFYFQVDEGFQVVFRSQRGRWIHLAFPLASLAVVVAIFVLVLREGAPTALTWLVASLFALAAIVVLYLLRNAWDPGPVVVDGSMRRITLPRGAEVPFERVRGVATEVGGTRPLVRIHLEDGELLLWQRRQEDARRAGEAVARLIGAEPPRGLET